MADGDFKPKSASKKVRMQILKGLADKDEVDPRAEEEERQAKIQHLILTLNLIRRSKMTVGDFKPRSVSDGLQKQLLEGLANKEEAERRAKEEEERQEKIQQAISARSSHQSDMVAGIATAVLAAIGLICGIVAMATGNNFGTALAVGLVSLLIAYIIIGKLLEGAFYDTGAFFHETNKFTTTFTIIATIATAIVAIVYRGNGLLCVSGIVLICGGIIYLVGQSALKACDDFINNANSGVGG